MEIKCPGAHWSNAACCHLLVEEKKKGDLHEILKGLKNSKVSFFMEI